MCALIQYAICVVQTVCWACAHPHPWSKFHYLFYLPYFPPWRHTSAVFQYIFKQLFSKKIHLQPAHKSYYYDEPHTEISLYNMHCCKMKHAWTYSYNEAENKREKIMRQHLFLFAQNNILECNNMLKVFFKYNLWAISLQNVSFLQS